METDNNANTSKQSAPRVATQFHTECQVLANASYKCLEKNAGDKDKCQGKRIDKQSYLSMGHNSVIAIILDAFELYRDCRTKEHRKKIEERRRQTAM